MTPRLVSRRSDGTLRTITFWESARIGTARDSEVQLEGKDIAPLHARIRVADEVPWIEDAGSAGGTRVNGERLAGRRALGHLDVITVGEGQSVILLLNDAGGSPTRAVVAQPIRPPDALDASAVVDLPPAAGSPTRAFLAQPMRPPASLDASAMVEIPPAPGSPTRAMPARPVRPPASLDASAVVDMPQGPAQPATRAVVPRPVRPPDGLADSGSLPITIDSASRGVLFRMSGPTGAFESGLGVCVVGRDRAATFQIDSRQVSRRHATITITTAGVILEDLGSSNGTKLNGKPLTGRAPLEDGDRVEFATFVFRVQCVRPEGAS